MHTTYINSYIKIKLISTQKKQALKTLKKLF